MKKPSDSNCSLCHVNRKCIFKDLDSTDLEEIKKNATSHTYKKNQVIFLQGNEPHGLYCVSGGKVKIVITDIDGKEVILRLNTESDIMGHVALFSGELYRASAIALEDSDITFYKKDFIFRMSKIHSSIGLNILTQLSQSMGATEQSNANLVHKNVRERLAGLLLSLKVSYGRKENDSIRLNIILTREEMATMIGTTCETLARLITEFRNEGIIKQEGKMIIILDEKKLVEFANA
jgi:CRP-like cAMP-binding protein